MNTTTRSVLEANSAFWDAVRGAAGDEGEEAGLARLALSDDPIAQAIGRVADELDVLDDDLVSRCQSLAERLNLAARDTRAGNHVARNGVVQQSALDIDRMCAERARCVDHLKILTYAWSRANPTAVVDLGEPEGGRYWRVTTGEPADHPDAISAAVHARATGSVGATYNEVKVERWTP